MWVDNMITKKIQWQVGRTVHEFEVEGDNLFEVLQEARKVPQQMVAKCGICEHDHLSLISMLAGEEKYEYIKIKCQKCKATLTLGKNKDIKDSYFIRRKEDNTYDWQPEFIKDMLKRPSEEHSIQQKQTENINKSSRRVLRDISFPGDEDA